MTLAMTTTADAHCRRLTRQLTSCPASFRVRARPRPCAPACIGGNRDCRVSARQCASVATAIRAPAVGHDVGTGGVRRGALGRGTPSAPANPAATTAPMQVACQAAPTASLTAGPLPRDSQGGNRYFPAERANRRPREQPPIPTEFVSRVRGPGSPEAGVVRPTAEDATWANVARRVANGRGRRAALQPGLSASSTGIQPLRPRVRRRMNGNTHAARSEA